MNIPVYSLTFNENDEIAGVQTISLVDKPAIESDWIALSKESLEVKFKANDVKQYVTGAVLIPDKKILRMDKDNNPFYIVFSEELIEKLRNKYHRDMLSHSTNINHDHEQTLSSIYDIESWIVVNSKLDKSAALDGLDEFPKGTWALTKHIPDVEIYQKVKNKEINGFSIEAMVKFDQLIKNSTEVENKNKNQKMEKSKSLETILSKVEQFFSKLETIVLEEAAPAEAPAAEVKLEDYTTADGKKLSIDADKNATLDGEVAPKGEYLLDDGQMAIVDENSLLVEIKPAPANPQDQQPAAAGAAQAAAPKLSAADFKEAFAKVNVFLGQSIYANYTLEDGRDVSLNVVEVNEARVWNSETEMSEVLADGTYLLKDGGELVIESGKVKSAPNLTVEAPVAAAEEQLSKVPKTIAVNKSKKLKEDAPLWERYAHNALKHAKGK